jgi:hypothetical protein
MSQIIQSGDVFRFAPSPDNMLPHLPKGVYKIVSTPDGYVFVRQEPFKKITKVYGNHGTMAKRIYCSFKDRENNTGVLLAGTKGSGKSYLGRLLSQEAADEGLPTIIITEPLSGETLRGMLSHLDQRVVILIDEFEKVYDDTKSQLTFLSLLDGLSTTKHLFILTVNDVSKVDQHMKNRPGRLYYLLEFNGLEEDFIREYCEAKLDNKEHIEELLELTSLFDEFNFDMLSSLVEEMNRFKESALDAVRYLNIAAEGNLRGRYNATVVTLEGVRVNNSGYWEGNPVKPQGHPITYWGSGEDDEEVELNFGPDNLIEKSHADGIFRYQVDGFIITLKNLFRNRKHHESW